MKTSVPVSRIALAAVLLGVAGFAVAQNATRATGAPSAKPPVLIIDRQAIVMNSKLGQDIHRQIMAYENAAQTELGAEGQTLQSQMQALQQPSASMTPAERDKKMQALQAKEAAYRQKVQARQSLIQGGEMVARDRYMAELDAAVQAVMLERGADVVVQKPAIVASVGGLDITQAVIQRLDRKITSFKVPLVNPPANSQVPLQ